MAVEFDDLDKFVLRIFPGYDQAGLGEPLLIGWVEFETVAVTLRSLRPT